MISNGVHSHIYSGARSFGCHGKSVEFSNKVGEGETKTLQDASATRYRFKTVSCAAGALNQYTTTFDPHDFRHFHDYSILQKYEVVAIISIPQGIIDPNRHPPFLRFFLCHFSFPIS